METRPAEEIAAEARATLQRIQAQAASLSPAARARLNQKLRGIAEGIKRHQAEQQVGKYLQRQPYQNGNHKEDDQTGQRYIDSPPATADTHAGGQRRPDAWLNGQAWFEEQA